MGIGRGSALVVMLAARPFDAPAAEPLARLELSWIEPQGHTPETEAMRESRSLLRRLGVDAHWRRAEPAQMGVGPTAVILLRGRRPSRKAGSFLMGATQRGTSAVWIYPEAVAATLGLREVPRDDGPGRAAFGSALGRVIAHELVHALLGLPHHAPFGLMALELDRKALLDPRLAVDPDTHRALRRALN